MVQAKKLSFWVGYNMSINKSVVYAIFGNRRSRDRDLETLQPRKTAIFRSKIY